MKTKISAVTVAALTIGTTLVMVTASFLVHAVTPKQGDPIPGVDVSIEQSPGGIIIASTQTDAQGIATFANIGPGKYILKTWIRPSRSSNNYNNSKSNTAGLANAKIISGTLNFSRTTPGKATIEVTGSGPKTITITAKEGADQKQPKPSQ